jgi:hypothetical protein
MVAGDQGMRASVPAPNTLREPQPEGRRPGTALDPSRTPDSASDGRAPKLDALRELLPEERHPGATSAADHTAVGGAGAQTSSVPVLEVLRELLPEGLRRGEAVSVLTRDRSVDYLALSLLAGALHAGLWCAAVGVAGLGGLAVAELLGVGADRAEGLSRLLVVPDPGARWAEVAAALADGVDLLLVQPPAQVDTQIARRVDARLRQGRTSGTRHSAAMAVLGAWPTARLALRTARTVWVGLDGIGPTAGTGHLAGGRATVVAETRGAGRPHTARLWLPSATGAAAGLTDLAATAPSTATSTTSTPDADTTAPGTSRRLTAVA